LILFHLKSNSNNNSNTDLIITTKIVELNAVSYCDQEFLTTNIDAAMVIKRGSNNCNKTTRTEITTMVTTNTTSVPMETVAVSITSTLTVLRIIRFIKLSPVDYHKH
jgi:hypothetical protein